MKLAISNIAWDASEDEKVYELLEKNKFSAIEIAPTRWFERPYEECQIQKAVEQKKRLYEMHGLFIASMQSIWYGREERIFGTKKERSALIEYTKRAAQYAGRLQCANMVFGSPRNRSYPEGMLPEQYEETAYDFFSKLAQAAWENGTVLSMEANPVMYHTNFLNTTKEALDFVKKINHPGMCLNYDIGTVIANDETLLKEKEDAALIHHVHISEPNLEPVIERRLHKTLIQFLKQEGYRYKISIEMKKKELKILKSVIQYIGGIGNGNV